MGSHRLWRLHKRTIHIDIWLSPNPTIVASCSFSTPTSSECSGLSCNVSLYETYCALSHRAFINNFWHEEFSWLWCFGVLCTICRAIAILVTSLSKCGNFSCQAPNNMEWVVSKFSPASAPDAAILYFKGRCAVVLQHCQAFGLETILWWMAMSRVFRSTDLSVRHAYLDWLLYGLLQLSRGKILGLRQFCQICRYKCANCIKNVFCLYDDIAINRLSQSKVILTSFLHETIINVS